MWQNRIVGYANVPVEELKANPRNWRTHNKRQEETLNEVLTDVGIVQNIVVNQRTGLVVDGHLRLALASKQGQDAVPVTYIDVSEEEEALIMATFDPIGALAATDTKMLNELMEKLPSITESVSQMMMDITSKMADTLPSFATPPPLVPITYEDAAPPQPTDKSKNLLGDPLSKTYDAPKDRVPDYAKPPKEDAWEPEEEVRQKPKTAYTPRAGEEWVVDHTHRIYVTTNPEDAWLDRDWRPIMQSKQPMRFFDALHRTICDMQTDAATPVHLVACTDSNCKHYWYQLALRPDVAAMFIANCDDMKLFTEML